MFMSHHQNAGQNPNINIANKSLKTVADVHILENDSKKLKLHS